MAKKEKISWIEIIFWIALGVFVLWIIAKIFGLIHSPAILDVIPYISGIFMAGAIWQQFKDMKKDLGDIKGITKRFETLEHEHKLALNGKLKIKHR